MKHFMYTVSEFVCKCPPCVVPFFFNDAASTGIYTLSLHDALPIFWRTVEQQGALEERNATPVGRDAQRPRGAGFMDRSEEHTSELQSLAYLVCRLLLEKKKE